MFFEAEKDSTQEPRISKKELQTDPNGESQNLLRRQEQGDYTSFWQLWERHQDYLYSRCLHWMGGNHADAQEALSRASLKAWEKLPNYANAIANPKAWLTRLTYNLCMDIHRERKKGAVGIESLEEIAVADSLITSSSDSPESALLRSELSTYIRDAIDSLPRGLRDVFILRCCQEMSYSDITKKLGISNETNTRKRIHQARVILQQRLNKYLSGWDNSSFPLKRGKPDLEGSGIDPLATSFKEAPIAQECILEQINYRATAICSLLHPWYNSPSRLG